jgi:hypothetical protein
MGRPDGRAGGRKRRDRPPPRIFLAAGAGLFVLNHLSVVFGAGLQPEALMPAAWLAMMGGWSLAAGRTFDAVWAWADPRGWRVIGFILLTFVAALGLAEAIAWFAYGQHLFG